MKLTRCDASGTSDDRRTFIFRMTGDDGHDYDFEITHNALLELFATCWTNAEKLTGGVPVAMVPIPATKVRVDLHETGWGPGLDFQNGPLSMHVKLSLEELRGLSDVLQRELGQT